MAENNSNNNDFIKLLTGHQSVIRSFIISLIPGDPHVEDILQDVNVILWEKRADFTMGSSFQSWAFAVAHNQTRSFLRKSQKVSFSSFDEGMINVLNDAWQERIHSPVSRKQSALNQCLASLSEKDQSLIQARYQTGSSLEQYASKVKRSGSNLRVTLFRIRKKLKDCVNKRLQIIGEEV